MPALFAAERKLVACRQTSRELNLERHGALMFTAEFQFPANLLTRLKSSEFHRNHTFWTKEMSADLDIESRFCIEKAVHGPQLSRENTGLRQGDHAGVAPVSGGFVAFCIVVA